MRSLRRSIALVVLAGALVAPASRVSAQTPQPKRDAGLGIRLLEAPVSERDDPRAQVYVIDHVAAGASFTRRLEISNDTPNPMHTELYVAPVNMHYMMTQSFWEKASEANLSKEDVQKSADAIADYTRNAFIKAAQEDPKKHFVIVDKAGPKTLILETAIVQLVPSKAVLNALGFVSWIPTAVILGGSTASGSEDQGKGLVAIEGRVRDGATGQVVGEFADRERPPTAIVDIKSLNWWAPARKVIDNWGKQFIALSNSPGGTVKSSPTFELLVW